MTVDGRPALLDGVGPEVYRRNAFRITGLRVDATARDIRRQAEKLRVAQHIPEARAVLGSLALPLEPPPEPDEIERAVQRLRDPARRVVDELFWFWPSRYGEIDEAIAALDRGDIAAAEREWRRQAASPADAPVAVHNLAVLAHAQALDRPDQDRGLWGQALSHWRTLVQHAEFWVLVDDRLDALDDARLKFYTGQKTRTQLPAVLLSINARLAVRAARDGRYDDAARHVALVRESGFGDTVADGALVSAVDQDADRVRTLCAHARDIANAEPRQAAVAAKDLLDRARAPLDTLAAVLRPDHPILEGAKDEVALRARTCLVIYTNETEKWATAAELLKRAVPVAATGTARARVAKDLDIVTDNLVYDSCWFCKENRPDRGSAHKQQMYGEVSRQYVVGGQQIKWRSRTIEIPRCTRCKDVHDRENRVAGAIGCVGGPAVVALGIAAFAGGITLLGVLLLVLAVVVGVVAVNRSFASSARKTISDFPPIRAQLNKGWKFGEKPST